MTGSPFQYIASSRVRFHQELHLRPRRISHYRFLYVESGSGEYRIAEETFQVTSGWLGLLAPGVRENRYFGREPVSYLFVEFQAAARLTKERAVPFPGQEPQRSALIGLLKTIQAEQADAGGCLLAAAVRLMFPEADRGEQRRLDDRLRKVVRLIEAHLLGFASVFQFSAQYRQVLGHPPSVDRGM